MAGRVFLALAVLSVGTMVTGCKGAGSGVAGRNKSNATLHSSGPSLGDSHMRTSRREAPALENSEYLDHQPVQLPTAPRYSNKPQVTCPIDGNSLGRSGTPIAVTLKGEPVFVCCPDCAKKAQKNPDKYLERVRLETAARD